MKKYYLLLPLLFGACMDSVEPVALKGKFKYYDPIQHSCIALMQDETTNAQGELVFGKAQQECRVFIEDLSRTNEAYVTMISDKNSAAYYTAKERFRKEKLLLKKQAKYLNLVLKDIALDAIDHDQLAVFSKVAGFAKHPMNYSYYRYMQKHPEQFKTNAKMLDFEKSYASKRYGDGYALANRGKFTKALVDLRVATNMHNAKAAHLCGDIYRFLYPSKSAECYLKAVENGDTSAMLDLAQAYEEEHDLKSSQGWYQKSAQSGNFIAQYHLSQLPGEDKEKWLSASAKSGYDKAQFAYGVYLHDAGKATEAKRNFLAAAKQAYPAAYLPLGKLCFDAKEYKMAFRYLSKVDDDKDALYMLGYMKEKGKGTSKNYYSAYDYYKGALALGKQQARSDLKRVSSVKKRLRKQQIKAQQRSAKADERKIKADRQRRRIAQQEDARIKQQIKQSRAEAVRMRAQACGHEPNASNLRQSGTRIHLDGVISTWLGKDAFIVKAQDGEEYYVSDENDEARLNKGDAINCIAITSGQREQIKGFRRSLFEEADESSMEKAYALEYAGECPY